MSLATLDAWVDIETPHSKKKPLVLLRGWEENKTELLKHGLHQLTIDVIDRYFPELSGRTFFLRYTFSAYGRFLFRMPKYTIALNPEIVTKNPLRFAKHVIGHELTHIIQHYFEDFEEEGRKYFPELYERPFPTGEESCDLYTYARHPDLVVPGRGSYIRIPLSADPKEVHELAVEAIVRRNKGYRTYIKWFKEEVYKRWKAEPLSGSSSSGPSSQSLEAYLQSRPYFLNQTPSATRKQ